MNIIIKNAVIVDPSGDYHQKKMDVKIENGTISEIASEINASDFEVVSFENLHVSNGWMDASVSFGEPGFEDRETIENGLTTSAKSGYTYFSDQTDTQPVIDNQSIVSIVNSKDAYHATSLHPVVVLNINHVCNVLSEMFDMQTAGAI